MSIVREWAFHGVLSGFVFTCAVDVYFVGELGSVKEQPIQKTHRKGRTGVKFEISVSQKQRYHSLGDWQ